MKVAAVRETLSQTPETLLRKSEDVVVDKEQYSTSLRCAGTRWPVLYLQLLSQQFLYELRVGLPPRRPHHLTHQKLHGVVIAALDFFDNVGMRGDHFGHGLVEFPAIGDLSEAARGDNLGGRAALLPQLAKDFAGRVLVDSALFEESNSTSAAG